MIKNTNRELKLLDEGGYKLKQHKRYMNLRYSDIHIHNTYWDRLGILPNTMRNLSDNFDNIFAHAFTMQQAVEKMPNRWDVDVR